MKKNFLLSLLALALSPPAWALLVEDDNGVKYHFNIVNEDDLTCELTYAGEIQYTLDGVEYHEYESDYSGDLVIPETITYNNKTYTMISVGEYACINCTSLTSVIIPNTVTTINDRAFQGCSALKEITIGEKVTSISSSAFGGCSGLETVNYNAIACSSAGSFLNHVCIFSSSRTQLSIVNIGEKVTSIPDNFLYGCTRITEITIPDAVTNIGGSAFAGCSCLETVYFNATACSSLSSSFPIFEDCTQLSTAVIGENVTMIPNFLFYGCSGISEFTIPNSVTSIGKYAFSGCSSIKELTIPNSVTSIGNYAFANCSSIEELTIPNSVTSIGKYAFSGCSSIKDLTIPNSITSIENGTFCDCSGIEELTIPSSVTSIGSSAFNGCSSIKDLTIPENIAEIGGATFANCANLTRVTFNATACSSTGTSPIFGNCTQLSIVEIGENVTMIPNYLFSGCSAIEEIFFPENVTTIGDYAFRDCIGLTEVTIPENIAEIGGATFANCANLTGVTFNATACSSTGTSPIFGNCTQLSTAVIGENVTMIPAYIFYDCAGITEITFPEKLETIGNYAFYGCTGITEITLPKSISQIGGMAFYYCKDLIVTSYNPEPPTCAYGAFRHSYDDGILYVPLGTVQAYAKAVGWNEFINIVPLGLVPPTVTTLEATDITHATAVLHGSVVIGNEDILHVGFEYWTDGGTTRSYYADRDGDTFSFPLRNILENDTKYYYRAYAETDSGKHYGEELSFTTDETNGIDGIAADGAEIVGYYSPDGQRRTSPTKGVNIVRLSDGTTKKVLVK